MADYFILIIIKIFNLIYKNVCGGKRELQKPLASELLLPCRDGKCMSWSFLLYDLAWEIGHFLLAFFAGLLAYLSMSIIYRRVFSMPTSGRSTSSPGSLTRSPAQRVAGPTIFLCSPPGASPRRSGISSNSPLPMSTVSGRPIHKKSFSKFNFKTNREYIRINCTYG